MNTYESKPLRPVSFSKPLKEMTDEELAKLLAISRNYNVVIPILIEVNTRQERSITELTKRISFLEDKMLKKAGRPKVRFEVNGQELTDDYLLYLVDYDFLLLENWKKKSVQAKINCVIVITKQRRKKN